MVPVGEAKTTLSKLLVLAEQGDDVVISRSGVPVARLVPVVAPRSARRGGFLAEQIWIGADFDDPLPAEIQQGFGGGAPDGSPSRG